MSIDADPQSKRYADTEEGRCELLRRHNRVASYVLGEHASCVLFFTRYGESRDWSASEDLPIGGGTPEFVFSHGEGKDQMSFFAIDPVIFTLGAASHHPSTPTGQCSPTRR